MADVSTRLRRARQRAGLEVADISARTKIKPAFVVAMDEGQLGVLPGQFFTRAFLKAYAAEVGLDPAEIARQYDEQFGRTDPLTLEELATVLEQQHPPLPPLAERLRRQWATFSPRMPLASMHGVRIRVPQMQMSMRGLRPAIGALLLVVALVAAAFLRTPDSQASEQGAVGTSGVAEGAPGATPLAGGAVDTLTMAITPAAEVWVAAMADGERAIYRLLKPGERVTLEAQRELAFRIGNAAAFQYSINGITGKPLGGPDEVKEFSITPANYRSYAGR